MTDRQTLTVSIVIKFQQNKVIIVGKLVLIVIQKSYAC